MNSSVRIGCRLMRRIRNALLNTRIITKMTAIYVLAILIPSVLMAVYGYRESVRLTEQEALSDATNVFAEVYSLLTEQINDVTYLADQIAYNMRLRVFLAKDYRFQAYDILTYRDVIFPVIEYASAFPGNGVTGIRVFAANDSIPEYWPYFYHEERAQASSWFDEFISSPVDSRWIYPSDSALSSDYVEFDSERVFTHARKIFGQSMRLVGTLAVHVGERHLLQTLDRFADEHGNYHLISSSLGTLYSSGHSPGLQELGVSQAREDQHTLVRRGPMAYISRRLPSMDHLVVGAINLRARARETNPNRYLIPVVIITSVALLEIISYLGLTRLLRRMRQMSETMDRAAAGDFNTRIPVTTHDEMGQIAKDFNIMIAKINDLVTETVERETTQKDAQLRALQLQINPHFIYNTIDTFRMQLVLEKNFKLADGLATFGKMLRYNVKEGNLYATLEEELEYVRKYLFIQRIRYSDRIELHDRVQHEHRDDMILKFVLQPIVENSVTHGITSPTQRIRIEITSRLENGLLEVQVRDDGAGISNDDLWCIRKRLADRSEDSIESGIGLSNIHRRLRLYYGRPAGLTINSEPGRFTSVRITAPVEAGGPR